MSEKPNINNFTDPLNETIRGDIIPLAFSTEIKTKKCLKMSQDKEIHDYSFLYAEDSQIEKIISCNKDAPNNQSVIEFGKSSKNFSPCNPLTYNDDEEGVCDISSRYLEKHEQPNFRSDDEPHFIDDKTPLRESNIDLPNSRDLSHFCRFSNPINDSFNVSMKRLSLAGKTHIIKEDTVNVESDSPRSKGRDTYDIVDDDLDENNETVYMMKQVQAIDLDETTVSGIDELLADVTLSGSLDVTKLASNLRMSDNKKAERRRAAALEAEAEKDALKDEPVVLLSNKSCLLWIGVPVQVSDIKSFTLNLKSSLAQTVYIQIKKPNSCFFLTNQLGQDRTQNTSITFEPKTDKKFYVNFHPTNSNYHSDIIVITVADRKFKINLFGYGEPAIVELKGFCAVDDPNKAGKEALLKSFPRIIGQNTLSISVFNSGARTAFVALFAQNTAIKFTPRMFLLIPKTKMEFDVRVTVTADMKVVDFMMITVDEELRRASRINVTELAHSDRFDLFNHIQIFSRLPDEKTIRQDDLPKFDYRRHLSRQINTSLRSCYLDLTSDGNQSLTGDRWTNDSASTIGTFSKSSLTVRSALSNVERLYTKSPYGHNTDNTFMNSLNQTLSAVVILNDVNHFPDTPVTDVNYLGILIRNNNQCSIEWRISDMVASYQDSVLGHAFDDHKLSSDTSSVYSLTSIPLYNTAENMSILVQRGSLSCNESVVVPVRFCPMFTGQSDCRCRVKIFTTNDDSTYERELAFIGHSPRITMDHEHSSTSHSKMIAADPWNVAIPGLLIERQVETTVRWTDIRDGKVPLKVTMKNRSRHNMQVFASRLTAPFELKVTSIYLVEKSNILCVALRPPGRGTYRDVVVFVDQDGNSTFTQLVVHIK